MCGPLVQKKLRNSAEWFIFGDFSKILSPDVLFCTRGLLWVNRVINAFIFLYMGMYVLSTVATSFSCQVSGWLEKYL